MNLATRYQVRRERALREELQARSDVQKALQKLQQVWSGRGFSPRRGLLSNALRLTRSMSPEIADCLAQCRELLGIERPVEVFVKPEPVFNASISKNETGPLMLVLSSRLLEVFTPGELRFVIGHELGHASLDHFGIPMPAAAMVQELGIPFVPRHVALQLYAWCRGAELSADRVGLVCAQDPDAAASGFFKLASGMSSPRVKPDLAAYARQVESLASAPLAREKVLDNDDTLDCFSTHPYSPVRVRAVYAFSRSAAYHQALGRPTAGTLTDDELENLVMGDLGLMEPGYLEESGAESDTLRRLLFSAGVVVAAANGRIEPSEVTALSSLLGADAVNYGLNVDTARADLDGRIKEAVAGVTLARRAQLVQHLCIVAAADGEVDDLELARLLQISNALGVDARVVEQTLLAAADPMD